MNRSTKLLLYFVTFVGVGFAGLKAVELLTSRTWYSDLFVILVVGLIVYPLFFGTSRKKEI